MKIPETLSELLWCSQHHEPVIRFMDGSWSCRWQLVVETSDDSFCKIEPLPIEATLTAELAEARELLATALDIIETPYYHIGERQVDQIKQIAVAVEKARKGQ